MKLHPYYISIKMKFKNKFYNNEFKIIFFIKTRRLEWKLLAMKRNTINILCIMY